jgi:[ribosomal protein S5]-alanine N-acetyltransferase
MEVFTALETERLFIRQLHKTDEEAFILLMTNQLVTNNLAFDETVKTKEGAADLLKQTIESYRSDDPLLAFAVTNKINNSFVGVCGINFLNQESAEVFYAFLPAYWGKGYATEVLAEMKDFLFQKHAVKEIHAFIAQHNRASIKVAEKIGFKNKGLVFKENFSDKVYAYVMALDPGTG